MAEYVPSPEARKDARNIMAVMIAEGDSFEDIVREMVFSAMSFHDYRMAEGMSAESYRAGAVWAAGEIRDFVEKMQANMGSMVEYAVFMHFGEASV